LTCGISLGPSRPESSCSPQRTRATLSGTTLMAQTVTRLRRGRAKRTHFHTSRCWWRPRLASPAGAALPDRATAAGLWRPFAANGRDRLNSVLLRLSVPSHPRLPHRAAHHPGLRPGRRARHLLHRAAAQAQVPRSRGLVPTPRTAPSRSHRVHRCTGSLRGGPAAEHRARLRTAVPRACGGAAARDRAALRGGVVAGRVRVRDLWPDAHVLDAPPHLPDARRGAAVRARASALPQLREREGEGERASACARRAAWR
jgi:hypothetical protein